MTTACLNTFGTYSNLRWSLKKATRQGPIQLKTSFSSPVGTTSRGDDVGRKDKPMLYRLERETGLKYSKTVELKEASVLSGTYPLI